MSALSSIDILGLYDEEVEGFRKANLGATRYAETPEGVRGLGETAHAFSNFFELTGSHFSTELIRAEIEYFRSLNRSFRWNIRSDLNPGGLTDALLSAGFVLKESGSLMVLDLAGHSPAGADLSHEFKVTELGIDEIGAMMNVQKEVWKDHFDADAFGETLKSRKLASPDFLRFFGAYASDRMVSCAWMKTTGISQFVHLNGGSTLSEFRGKGIYRALLDVRADVARQLHKKFLMIEAGPMSRPIVEKLGFGRLCDVFEYEFLV